MFKKKDGVRFSRFQRESERKIIRQQSRVPEGRATQQRDTVEKKKKKVGAAMVEKRKRLVSRLCVYGLLPLEPSLLPPSHRHRREGFPRNSREEEVEEEEVVVVVVEYWLGEERKRLRERETVNHSFYFLHLIHRFSAKWTIDRL